MGKAWWQGLAALLPPLIAVSTFLQHNSTYLVRGVTLGSLLLAIVLVQLYGRASDQRERIKTAAEGKQQQAAAEARFSEQTDLLSKQTDLLLALFSEIQEGRSDAEQRVSDLLRQITSGRREAILSAGRIRAGIDRIADGIDNLANYLSDKDTENG
jgi:hypothetical protein